MTQSMTVAEKRLLEQGILDYVDAVNAIDAFRALVQGKCRRVVEAHRNEYAAALGVEFSKNAIKNEDSNEESSRFLGVKCIIEPEVRVELYHCVTWDPTEGDHRETSIGMWVFIEKTKYIVLSAQLSFIFLDFS